MTRPDQQPPDQPPFDQPPFELGRVQRKRDRIRSEIQRNRAGGHRVPTWALAVVLGALLLCWLYLVVTS